MNFNDSISPVLIQDSSDKQSYFCNYANENLKYIDFKKKNLICLKLSLSINE